MGQVKYVGFLDNSSLDLTLYAGVRLDDDVGSMDGLHKVRTCAALAWLGVAGCWLLAAGCGCCRADRAL